MRAGPGLVGEQPPATRLSAVAGPRGGEGGPRCWRAWGQGRAGCFSAEQLCGRGALASKLSGGQVVGWELAPWTVTRCQTVPCFRRGNGTVAVTPTGAGADVEIGGQPPPEGAEEAGGSTW